MATLLLIIIYVSFISLGLPDGMLGAAWPVMRLDFAVPLGSAGIISMIISLGTVISSLFSAKLIKKFGTGMISLVSVFLTALALLLFSFAQSLYPLFLFAIPLGIGAGAIDSALNEYVAEHYEASHMNFLHSFWGIGALSGPVIMSLFLQKNGSWNSAYFLVAIIQFALTLALFFALPLWNHKSLQKKELSSADIFKDEPKQKEPLKKVLTQRGVKGVLVSFMLYTGIEATMGLWGASYLKDSLFFSAERAALWTSLFYTGIMAGRFISGFLAMRLSSKQLLKTGTSLISLGSLFLLLSLIQSLPHEIALIGFILVGLGCAPVFPGMLHETPRRFGKEHAQSIMGFQMAVAYTSTTILPPLFGLIASFLGTWLLPFTIVLYGFVLYILNKRSFRVFNTSA